MLTVTAEAKTELSRVNPGSPQVRGAELSALVRFAEGLHIGAHGLVVEVDVDHHGTARRAQRTIDDLYGYDATLRQLPASTGHATSRYVLHVANGAAEELARRTGLLDRRGRPVSGLPASLVGGSTAVAESLWRGAFLARGSLALDGRSTALNVLCPGLEAALALVGAARRLGFDARRRDVRDRVWVTVRTVAAIGELLDRLGAPRAGQACTRHHEQMHAHHRRDGDVQQLLIDANARRSEQAATATATRVQWALTVLGAQAPEHLAAVGRLRIEHPCASLKELGRDCDPPLSKDAAAGRLRRLIATAERASRPVDGRAAP